MTFAVTIDYWCSGMPFGCDVYHEGTRAGTIAFRSGTAQTQTARLTDADHQRFVVFLDDPTTMAAAWDTTRCPMGALDVSYPVVLTLENGLTVRKDINGCTGPAYDAMRGWMTTIQSYFP